MNIINTLKYMTHIPLLLACLDNTNGVILECGLGLGSTPILNGYSFSDRKVYSYDNDAAWVNQFTKFRSDNHVVEVINSWSDLDELYKTNFGIAFIDQAPAADRGKTIIKLKDTAELIVMHDANHLRNCAAREVFNEMKYKFIFTSFRPNTCVMSNTNDLSFLKKYTFYKE